MNKKDSIIEISYPQLLSGGVCIDYKIISSGISKQREYFLKDLKKGTYCLNQVPRSLRIEYDINNQRVRLLKDKRRIFGVSSWYTIKKKYPIIKKEEGFRNRFPYELEKSGKYLIFVLNKEKTPKSVKNKILRLVDKYN